MTAPTSALTDAERFFYDHLDGQGADDASRTTRARTLAAAEEGANQRGWVASLEAPATPTRSDGSESVVVWWTTAGDIWPLDPITQSAVLVDVRDADPIVRVVAAELAAQILGLAVAR